MVSHSYQGGARVALSTTARLCSPRFRPWASPSATRCLTTIQRPRDARPRAIEQHNASYSRRSYATADAYRPPKSVAVLGGGLTGLSTAWYLTKFMPEAEVAIYEGSGRMGGWIDSERVDVTAADGTKGTVVFERGARVVQPKTGIQNWDDAAFFELLSDIKPEHGWTGSTAYDRYFYYPDHLVRLPNLPGIRHPVRTLEAMLDLAVDALREPLYKGMPTFAWNLLRGSSDKPNLDDVSIGDEFLRRGGRREPVDNMLSAMCHGIYGGDVWKLSCESSIFAAAFMNQRLRHEPGSLPERWRGKKTLVPMLAQDLDLLEQMLKTKNEAVFKWLMHSQVFKSINFVNGFGTLTDAIVAKLKANPKVKFVNEKVTKLRRSASGGMEVTTAGPRLQQYDKVISTLYSKTLASLAPPGSLPSLASSTAATIRLVNLWSPTPNLNHPTKGFGYLLPQTVPAERNPHAALGVIFDSDRALGPDEPSCAGDTVPGTKLTVMLGGHHWDDIPAGFLPDAATDDDAAVRAAKDTVRIQMGIDPSAWQVAGTKLCADCIPQHLVGHAKRMAAADAELRAAFGGKLAVAGGSYTAPGVVGSVRAARDVAFQTAGRFRAPPPPEMSPHVVGRPGEVTRPVGGEVFWTVGDTGLARFVGGTARLWAGAPAAKLRRLRKLPKGYKQSQTL